MHKQFNSLKQKFHGLAKPWKISIYSAGMILALFLLFFAAKSVVEYRQYAIQQRQIHDAEMLAEKSQKSNDFPGMIPRSVKMRVDKSPHYYNNQ